MILSEDILRCRVVAGNCPSLHDCVSSMTNQTSIFSENSDSQPQVGKTIPTIAPVRIEFERGGYVLPAESRFMNRGIDFALSMFS